MSNNTNKVNNPMKVITGPDTRWSYANVWEPKSINGGTPKYSVSLIIPKSDTKTVAKLKAAIEAAYREEIPDLYADHFIGYDELAEAMDLTCEGRQSRSYRSLLGKVRGMNDLDALRELGKKVYALGLSRDQAGVFWYEYGKSRSRLMAGVRKGLGGTARHLLKRIRNANGDLAALGAMLYRIQQGDVKRSDPPAKHEWIVIWEAYHDQQAALRP